MLRELSASPLKDVQELSKTFKDTYSARESNKILKSLKILNFNSMTLSR